jgi:hypothetical protein
MKKHILLILIIGLSFYFSNSILSQDFVAGPKFGVAFTQVDGDTYKGFNKAGLNFGGFVYRPLNEKWNLQFEIEYMQKGSRKTPLVEENDYTDYKMDLHYLQFPVFARYKLKVFSFEAGLSIGTLISETEFYDGSEISEEDKVPFKNSELATLFSVNYHFNKRTWVNVRFSYSINRIRVPYGGEVPIYPPQWDLRKPGQYNNVIAVSVNHALTRIL